MNRLADPESRSMGPGRRGCEGGSLITGSVSAWISAVTTAETAGTFSFSSWAATTAESVETGCVSAATDGGDEPGKGAGWMRKYVETGAGPEYCM
jgi:hypothetical protein